MAEFYSHLNFDSDHLPVLMVGIKLAYIAQFYSHLNFDSNHLPVVMVRIKFTPDRVDFTIWFS